MPTNAKWTRNSGLATNRNVGTTRLKGDGGQIKPVDLVNGKVYNGYALNVEGSLDLDSSINAGDYNKVAGRVTLSSTTTTVTNSYVTSTSLIMLTWASDITDKDSALRVWINAQSAGSFTIKTSANASGEKINFLVIN